MILIDQERGPIVGMKGSRKEIQGLFTLELRGVLGQTDFDQEIDPIFINTYTLI